MTKNSKKLVILVPGVGLGGGEMIFLLHRLRQAGYQARIFWHWPWSDTLGAKARKLKQLVSSQQEFDVIHLVGHSLGGQIILKLFSDDVPMHLGRIVTLGTPHMGSAAARRVSRFPIARSLLSRALIEASAAGPLPLKGQCELGTIAGKLNLMLDNLLGVARPNDTLISEEEAKHPESADHILLPVSHGSMLVSPDVAKYVVAFLDHGSFAIIHNSPKE